MKTKAFFWDAEHGELSREARSSDALVFVFFSHWRSALRDKGHFGVRCCFSAQKLPREITHVRKRGYWSSLPILAYGQIFMRPHTTAVICLLRIPIVIEPAYIKYENMITLVPPLRITQYRSKFIEENFDVFCDHYDEIVIAERIQALSAEATLFLRTLA